MNGMSNKVMLLRHRNRYLSVAKDTKPYVVGFFKPTLIQMTKRIIDVNKDLKIDFDIKNTTVSKDTNIVIELNAVLTIPTLEEPSSVSGVEVEFYPAHDFFKLPYEKQLGIVIPEEIYETEIESWSFLCQTMDPCNNLEDFRNKLSIK